MTDRMVSWRRPDISDVDHRTGERFPFEDDRAAIWSFMHGVTYTDTGASLACDGRVLLIYLSRGDTTGGLAVATYDQHGGIELIMPANPMLRRYAVAVWNLMLHELGEDPSRRVEHKAITKRGQWPEQYWVLDNQPMHEHEHRVLCGRLSLAAWRSANPCEAQPS